MAVPDPGSSPALEVLTGPPTRQPTDEHVLGAGAAELVEAGLAANTRLAYARDFAAYAAWCEQAGRTGLPATAATLATYFHGCYSVGDDLLWGVNHRRKGIDNTWAALKSIRAARPDGASIYVILDNLPAHKNRRIQAWATTNKVRLLFTPTYASWANPIEAHFGPLRQFTLANSCHRNHTVQTWALHAYLRWRNTHARHPDVLAAQRRERARVRSEKGIRWGGRPPRTRSLNLTQPGDHFRSQH